MASNNREIEIIISARNLLSGIIDKAGDDLDGMGNRATETGERTARAGEIGRLGLWGFGEQVERLAQSMGLPMDMSRRLGNAIEGLVSTAGRLGMVLGGVGLVAMAGVAIWNHFAEAKKKAREETEKSVAALRGEVAALYSNKLQTDAVRDANVRVLEAKRKLLILELEKKVRDENKELADQAQKVKDLAFTYEAWSKIWGKNLESSQNRLHASREEQEKYNIAQQEHIANIQFLKALKTETPDAPGTMRGEQIAAETASLTAQRYEIDMLAQSYGLLDMVASAALSNIAGQEEVLSRASQFRSNVSTAANKAMETQILKLVETNRFSVAEFGKAVMQSVKIELVGIAARAAVWALFETAMGLATMFTNPAASAAHFASAAEFGLIAGATVAAAMAVNAISGPGATQPGAGEPGGPPIITQPTPGGSTEVAPVYNITLTIVNPLSDQNWDEAVEQYLMPALDRAGERNITINSNVIRQ